MKKVWLGSLIAAVAVEIIGAIINLISFAVTGDLLLCFELDGGEWIGYSGFGMMLNHSYPLSSPEHPVSGSVWIGFDPFSLILTLIISFVVFFIIFSIIHKIKEEITLRRTYKSARENKQ